MGIGTIGQVALSAMVGLVFLGGCPEKEHTTPPVSTSQPAKSAGPDSAPTTQPATQPASQPAEDEEPPAHVSVRIHDLTDQQEGWLQIEAIRDDAAGAWATGHFIFDSKLVIETENVEQFSLDLSDIRLNWDRRIVLRIDNEVSELTRKHWPVIHLKRTPAGQWVAVDPNP